MSQMSRQWYPTKHVGVNHSYICLQESETDTDSSNTAAPAVGQQQGAEPTSDTSTKQESATAGMTVEVPAEMGGYDLLENESVVVPKDQQSSPTAKSTALTFDDMMAMTKVGDPHLMSHIP